MKKFFKKKPPCQLRYDKKNLPLRIYFSSEAVKTLYISALIACMVVTCTLHLYYRDRLALVPTVVIALMELGLALFLGGHWMMHKAQKIVEPLEEMTAAMNQVTEGDFKVQITREPVGIKEIHSMISNFNTMTQALENMAYMSKGFISNVSHEVKTPIAAITGLAELLQDDLLTEAERHEYLGLVYGEAVRLSRLCENMLCISKLDHQTIATKHERVNLSEQIRRCIILLNEKWEAKALSFQIDLEDVNVISDPDLLQQVWINLLDNAIKYTQQGTTITISSSKTEEQIEIAIRDEGLGIAADKLPHIFERFYQCEASHQKQGNGLGLAIVERILQILGGSIACSSQEGRGTVMSVKLRA